MKIRQRNETMLQMSNEDLLAINKEIKKRIRMDKRKRQKDLVKKNMTIKDRWAGIKNIFSRKCMHEKTGTGTTYHQQAERSQQRNIWPKSSGRTLRLAKE